MDLKLRSWQELSVGVNYWLLVPMCQIRNSICCNTLCRVLPNHRSRIVLDSYVSDLARLNLPSALEDLQELLVKKDWCRSLLISTRVSAPFHGKLMAHTPITKSGSLYRPSPYSET